MHQMANKQFQSKKSRQVKCKAIKWQETCGWVKSGWRIEKNRVCVKSQLHIETNQFNEYETANDKMSEIIEDRQSVRALIQGVIYSLASQMNAVERDVRKKRVITNKEKAWQWSRWYKWFKRIMEMKWLRTATEIMLT